MKEYLLMAIVGVASFIFWLIVFDPKFSPETRKTCAWVAFILFAFEIGMIYAHMRGLE